MTDTTASADDLHPRPSMWVLRQRAGLSIRETARRLDIDHSTYWRWERDDRAPDGIIERIAAWADLAVDDATSVPATPFGRALHQLRIDHGDTLEAFAARAGLPPRTLRRWLAGQSVPHRSRLALIAGRTGADLRQLDSARTATVRRHRHQQSALPLPSSTGAHR